MAHVAREFAYLHMVLPSDRISAEKENVNANLSTITDYCKIFRGSR